MLEHNKNFIYRGVRFLKEVEFLECILIFFICSFPNGECFHPDGFEHVIGTIYALLHSNV